MGDLLEFEIQLANISLPREERRDASKLYNKMEVSEIIVNSKTFGSI